jgi:replication fork protection complex subunit Tof1/Swi1
MAGSDIEDDQEIAENIQNRIFYEETTHDRVIHLLKSYKDQGFGYLDAVTELAHTFIRLLESYSKQNADLQIRSRRRQRKKQKAAQSEGGEAPSRDNDDNANDIEQVQIVSRERKFDFTRFVARFLTQGSVNTFVSFLRYYGDLTREQLKRAHRFFYRVAFKNELGVLLYRVDIIKLFHQMIEGPEGLDQEASYYGEWLDLSKQLFRRMFKKLEERPELAVEMLFSKIPATVFYLEHGYDNVVQKAPRPPAELEVRSDMEWDQQVGVAVSVLINQSKSDALAWIKGQLADARDERHSWAVAEEARRALNADKPKDSDQAERGEENDASQSIAEDEEVPLPPFILVRPDTDERRTAMFKDNKLRLLMKLAGFQRLGDPDDTDASWVIPSTITADKLGETHDLIGKFEFDPPTYEDGKPAEDLLRSSAAAARTAERTSRKAAFDDDSDGGIDYDEDLGEYGAGGPTARKADGTDAPAKKRRLQKRKSASEESEETDEETRARREARAEKRRLKKMAEKEKFKSTVYVHDSDEEDDEEKDRAFFAAEEERRKKTARNYGRAQEKAEKEGARTAVSSKTKKRKSVSPDASASEHEEALQTRKKPRRKGAKQDGYDIVAISSDSSSSEGESDAESPKVNDVEMTDTPISSQVQGGSDGEDIAPPTSKPAVDITMKNTLEDDEDDILPVRSTARRRGGFVVESDEEE